jgi:hypothetical protein
LRCRARGRDVGPGPVGERGRPGLGGRGGPGECRPGAGWTEFGLEAGAGECRTAPRFLMPAQIGVKDAGISLCRPRACYVGQRRCNPAMANECRPGNIISGPILVYVGPDCCLPSFKYSCTYNPTCIMYISHVEGVL